MSPGHYAKIAGAFEQLGGGGPYVPPLLTLSYTFLNVQVSGGDATSYVSPSVSPLANSLVVLWIVNSHTGGPSAVTGNNITYNFIGEIILSSGTNARIVSLYAGSSPVPTAGAITVTMPTTRTGCAFTIGQYTLSNGTVPVIRQWKTAEDEAGTGQLAASVTLNTPPAVGSAIAMGLTKFGTATVEAGPSYTLEMSTSWSTPTTTMASVYDLSPPSATATATWVGEAAWAALAAEIGAP